MNQTQVNACRYVIIQAYARPCKESTAVYATLGKAIAAVRSAKLRGVTAPLYIQRTTPITVLASEHYYVEYAELTY